jgi:hypothetical protein
MWVIPCANTKMGNRNKKRGDFRVPLSDAALTVLRVVKGDREAHTGRIFTSRWDGQLSIGALAEVAEACLAHFPGGVEGIYQRGDYFDLRRPLLDRWATYVAGSQPDNVVPLRRSA